MNNMNSSESAQISPDPRITQALAWLSSAVVSIICITTGLGFIGVVRIFRNLFDSLGLELPFPIRFLLSNYTWLCPVIFLGIAVALIARQFIVKDIKRRFIETAAAAAAASVSVMVIVLAMYFPLFQLIWKLR